MKLTEQEIINLKDHLVGVERLTHKLHGTLGRVEEAYYLNVLRVKLKTELAEAEALVKDSDITQGASLILSKAAGHLADRASTYDSPGGERSMAKTVELFNTLYDLQITEDQGWRFMLLLKLVRSTQGNFKMDNHEDAVAYEALTAEFLANQQRETDAKVHQ
jgi:hypothetical protein